MKFINNIITSIAISLIAGLAANLAHADDSRNSTSASLSSAQAECDKVATEARKFPKANPASIYNYGSRVVNQGMRCLNAGIQQIQSNNQGNNHGSK